MLHHLFRRDVPDHLEYHQRLANELDLIEQHKLEAMFLRVREILDLMPDIPHNIRGSAGSSLVCYLLGITDIDPIAWDIPITRFMNELRVDMPDIDIDVPYNRREELFERVYSKYGNRVARVSNRVHRNGVFHNWSLHCGGIIILDHAVPKHMLLKPGQLNMNKDDVENAGLYKIDLLSSHALAQLADITDRPLFEYPREDENTAKMLASGNSIGIIGGESPAFRKTAMALNVSKMEDAVLATSLIRPAAAEGLKDKDERQLIFEDDVIDAISEAVGCSAAEADRIRRVVTKGQDADLEPELLKKVKRFRAYAFCKSHGVAYGAVVWALAWHKVRNPAAFWRSTLKHANPMYRRWVHPHEASAHMAVDPPQAEMFPLSPSEQWRKYGYWTSPNMIPGAFLRRCYNDVYQFKGPLATARNYTTKYGKKLCFLTVGIGDRSYINVTMPHGVDVKKWGAVEGVARLAESGVFNGVNVKSAWLGGSNAKSGK